MLKRSLGFFALLMLASAQAQAGLNLFGSIPVRLKAAVKRAAMHAAPTRPVLLKVVPMTDVARQDVMKACSVAAEQAAWAASQVCCTRAIIVLMTSSAQ